MMWGIRSSVALAVAVASLMTPVEASSATVTYQPPYAREATVATCGVLVEGVCAPSPATHANGTTGAVTVGTALAYDGVIVRGQGTYNYAMVGITHVRDGVIARGVYSARLRITTLAARHGIMGTEVSAAIWACDHGSCRYHSMPISTQVVGDEVVVEMTFDHPGSSVVIDAGLRVNGWAGIGAAAAVAAAEVMAITATETQ